MTIMNTKQGTDDFNDRFSEELCGSTQDGQGSWVNSNQGVVEALIDLRYHGDLGEEPAGIEGSNNQTINRLDYSPSTGDSERVLLVVDAQHQASGLRLAATDARTDIIIIDHSQSGLREIESALESQRYDEVKVLVGSDDLSSVRLGKDTVDSSWLSEQKGFRIITSLGEEVSGPAQAFIEIKDASVRVGNDASEYLNIVRGKIDSGWLSGGMPTELNQVYDSGSVEHVIEKLNGFVAGESMPIVEWAQFADQRILGCYVADSQKILLNQKLEEEPRLLEQVLLEEFGHWLEGGSNLIGDSSGDEGERFAGMMLQDSDLTAIKSKSFNSDHAILEIDGAWQEVELCIVDVFKTVSDVTTVTKVVSEDSVCVINKEEILKQFSSLDGIEDVSIESVDYKEGKIEAIELVIGEGGPEWHIRSSPGFSGEAQINFKVVDSYGYMKTVPVNVTFTAVNDNPRRMDTGPTSIYLVEDAGLTSLGLQSLEWSAGPEINKQTGQLVVTGYEKTQGLTVSVTELPDESEGELFVVDARGSSKLLNETDSYTVEDLQRLHFKPTDNYSGSTQFSYTVKDSLGGTATETITLNVLASNDYPTIGRDTTVGIEAEQIFGSLKAIQVNDSNIEKLLTPDTGGEFGSFKAKLLKDLLEPTEWQRLSAGLNTFTATTQSDGDSKESDQELVLKIASLPDSSFGTTLIQSRTNPGELITLGIGDVIEKSRLGALMFRPVNNFKAVLEDSDLEKSAQSFVFALSDDGNKNSLKGDSGKEILISIPIVYLRSNTEASSRVLAEIGGVGAIEGNQVNYVASARPISFEVDLQGAENTVVTHFLDTSLQGKVYDVVKFDPSKSARSGFSISENGDWSFNPSLYIKSYSEYLTQDQVADLSAANRGLSVSLPIYEQAGIERRLEFLLKKIPLESAASDNKEIIIAALQNGSQIKSTASPKEWIKPADDPLADRYFKYISDQTLKDYGAIEVTDINGDVVKDDMGNTQFTWGNDIKTKDGRPLTTLAGEIITKSGYYDFTRSTGSGDGAEFIFYETEFGGEKQQFIVGMNIYMTDNMFGDNSAAIGKIIDPGAPIQVLPEDDVTVISESINLVRIEHDANGPSTVSSQRLQEEVIGGTSNNIALPGLSINQDSESEISAMSIIKFNTEITSKSAGTEIEPADYSLNQWLKQFLNDSDPKKVEEEIDTPQEITQGRGYGFTLPALMQSEDSVSALDKLRRANILGLNLIDSMLIGLGCLYLIYGKQILKPISMNSLFGGGLGGTARTNAIAIFQYRDGKDNVVICAMKVLEDRLELLTSFASDKAYVDQAAMDNLTESIEKVIKEHAPELILLDESFGLQVRTSLNNIAETHNATAQLLTYSALTAAISGLSESQIARLQRHYEDQTAIKESHPLLYEQIRRRTHHYSRSFNEKQTVNIALLELALCLAQWRPT